MDGVPEIHTACESFLVGRDDADAVGQEQGISVCDILAAGVVDEDARVGEFLEEFEGLVDCEGGGSRCFEVLFPCGEGEGGGAVGGAEGFGGAGDEDE